MIAFDAQLTNFPKFSGIKKIEQEIAQKIAEDLQNKYQSGSDFNGSPWVPKKGSGQLLVDTGETFGSLNSSGNIVEIAGKMIYHQDGTSRLPARPIIGVGSQQEEIALKIATEALENILK
jgi:phage gpG-like protein